MNAGLKLFRKFLNACKNVHTYYHIANAPGRKETLSLVVSLLICTYTVFTTRGKAIESLKKTTKYEDAVHVIKDRNEDRNLCYRVWYFVVFHYFVVPRILGTYMLTILVPRALRELATR